MYVTVDDECYKEETVISGCKLDRIKTNGLYSFSKENTCKALTDFYLKIKVPLTGTFVFVNVLDSTLYIVYNIHVC